MEKRQFRKKPVLLKVITENKEDNSTQSSQNTDSQDKVNFSLQFDDGLRNTISQDKGSPSLQSSVADNNFENEWISNLQRTGLLPVMYYITETILTTFNANYFIEIYQTYFIILTF